VISRRGTSSSASLLKFCRASTAIRPTKPRSARYGIDTGSIRRSCMIGERTKTPGQAFRRILEPHKRRTSSPASVALSRRSSREGRDGQQRPSQLVQ
jgi:hypothetical protein